MGRTSGLELTPPRFPALLISAARIDPGENRALSGIEHEVRARFLPRKLLHPIVRRLQPQNDFNPHGIALRAAGKNVECRYRHSD